MLSSSKVEDAKAWEKQGYNIDEIADLMTVDRETVKRYLRDAHELKGQCRILEFDIETSPMEFLGWGLYDQRPAIHNIVKDWAILSWSAKWLFEPDIIGYRVSVGEAKARKDKSIIKPLWKLFNEADIIIGHNLDSFDIRKSNARFFLNGLKPTTPYQTIDTLKHSRKNFAFASHKLDYLGEIMARKNKIDTDYKLWKRCIGMYGAEEADKALDEMLKYNKYDVTLLEEVYLQLRPWMKSHPNIGLYVDTDDSMCRCGLKIEKRMYKGNHYYTPAGKFKSFQCDCGAVGRDSQSAISTAKRKGMTVSVAR